MYLRVVLLRFYQILHTGHLGLVNIMSLVELVEHEKEARVGQMRHGEGTAGSC